MFDFSEAANAEIRLIKEYNTFWKNRTGYNMTIGGEGSPGTAVTPETRQKMSDAHKKLYEDADFRNKMQKVNAEIGSRPSVRLGRSQRAKTRKWSKAIKEKMSHAHTGKIITEDTKQKIRENLSSQRSRRFCVIFPNGTEEIHHSLKQFCDQYNLCRYLFRKVLNKQKAKYNGMTGYYIE